jgi:glycosyltransferase involved in cell wall biosynthesis
MRITIVLGAFFPVPPTMGGAVEKAWFALAREFAARGHDVTMASRAMPDLARDEICDGVHHIRVSGFDTPHSLIWLKALDLIYSLRVRPVLPQADILVTNTFWLPMLIRDESRGKIYVHVGRYPKGQMRFYSHAARLQAPSSEIARAISRETPSAAVKSIPYPRPQVDTDEPISVDAREKIVLFVGRVHPEKGVHLLVDAFARVASNELAAWKLMIVGPNEVSRGGGGQDYLGRLREIVGCSPVEFRGPIFNEAQLAKEFLRARVFVYPSLAGRGETFGLAPLEAMSHGCAVIVSNLPCFRDFIVDNETGFVFDQNATDRAESLANALRSAVADPTRLAAIAEAGLRKSEEFSIARVADQFLQDFKLLNSEADGPAAEDTSSYNPVVTNAERTDR